MTPRLSVERQKKYIMRVFHGFDSIPSFGGAVVTLGSFDGLHRGHLELLKRCRESVAESGGESVVLTFATHPRVVLGRSEGLRLLMTTEEKIMLLEGYGIDNLIIIPFDKDFSRLSYEDFVKRYLVEMVGMKRLVAGYNHHLGRGSEGSYSSLMKLSEECGFEVERVGEWRDPKCGNVSSTVVRALVMRGEMERVSELLGRPYLVVAQVDGDGRVWSQDALKLFPAKGLYMALLDGKEAQVRVDENGAMWCADTAGNRVKIEIIRRA